MFLFFNLPQENLSNFVQTLILAESIIKSKRCENTALFSLFSVIAFEVSAVEGTER